MAVEAQGKSVRKPQRSWTKKGWDKIQHGGGGEIGREETEQQEREILWQSRSEAEVGVKGAVSSFLSLENIYYFWLFFWQENKISA